MICQRGVRLPAPTAPGLKMRPTQRPAAGGGAFPCARGRRWPTARLFCLPAPLTWRLRRIAYAAGRSRPPCRWGDPFRAVAQRPARIRWPIRFCPPGSDQPRQLRPALVCLRCNPLLLCEAIRPAVSGSRLRCAGDPLAAAGPIWNLLGIRLRGMCGLCGRTTGWPCPFGCAAGPL